MLLLLLNSYSLLYKSNSILLLTNNKIKLSQILFYTPLEVI